MSDLIMWLRGCLDEDERVARAVPEAPWIERSDTEGSDVISEPRDTHAGRDEVVLGDVWRPGMIEYVTRWDPARVLAEVDAKRAILDLHYLVHRDIGWIEDGDERYAELKVCGHCVPKHSHFATRADVPTGTCSTVRLLAQPYAGRDGWREEWRA